MEDRVMVACFGWLEQCVFDHEAAVVCTLLLPPRGEAEDNLCWERQMAPAASALKKTLSIYQQGIS